jgi:polyvinyl alcohol dehydrogenase (cytochrome)
MGCTTKRSSGFAGWLLLWLPIAVALAGCPAAPDGETDAGSGEAAEMAATGPPAVDGWPMWGQNPHNTRSQPAETVISAANASGLVKKWVTGVHGSILATPAVVDGFVYVPDSAGYLYKIDAETGDVVWEHKVEDYVNRKGDVARATPAVDGGSLIFGTQSPRIVENLLEKQQAYVVSVDAETGATVHWRQGVEETRAPRITQSAVVDDGTVYVGVAAGEEQLALVPLYKCCKHRGSVVSLDAATGEILHKQYMIPQIEGLSGGSVWGSTAVVDTARSALYVTTGNNYSVPESVEKCLLGCIDSNCSPEETEACLATLPDNHFDSIVALDLENLQVKWAHQGLLYDAWADPCVVAPIDSKNCPDPAGPDFDFGQGPSLITLSSGRQLLGAAQKSGIYWALNPDTGAVVWETRVGPGGLQGGSEWGSATDGERVYVAISNSDKSDWTLQGNGTLAGFVVSRGFWSALDAATGTILWQTPEPKDTLIPLRGPKGPVTVANGVLFGGTTTSGDHTMFALDAASGAILWTYDPGGTVNSGAAVVDGVVYWGAIARFDDEDDSSSEYATGKFIPEGEGKLFAFCVGGTDGCPVPG